jgi:2-polyprenyl-3-methyl-5-hydroxy-6-metoxy-1,4-benzoquinol methylase
MKQAGYRAIGLEIGETRASFAKQKLGISVLRSLEKVEEPFDLIFSSHVLEHIGPVRDVISWSLNHLVPGGLFIAVTPNGSAQFRSQAPKQWNRMWGDVHPLYLDAPFWHKQLLGYNHLITSQFINLEMVSTWALGTQFVEEGPLDGWELLAIARKPSALHPPAVIATHFQ